MLFFNAFLKYFLRLFKSLISSSIRIRARFVLVTQSLEWAAAGAGARTEIAAAADRADTAAGPAADTAVALVLVEAEAAEDPVKLICLKAYFTLCRLGYLAAWTLKTTSLMMSCLL